MNPQLITARNRANAAHSTGPKTEAGKRRSSLNGMRHGLTGHTIILPSEDLDAYHTFTKQFFDDFKPVGIVEKQFVQSLADTAWRLNRIPALENNLLALGFSEHEDNITTEHPEAHAALVIIEALREEVRAFNVLSLHGARLSRQYREDLHELRALQSERRAAEASQPLQNKTLPKSGFVFSTPDVGQASSPLAPKIGPQKIDNAPDDAIARCT